MYPLTAHADPTSKATDDRDFGRCLTDAMPELFARARGLARSPQLASDLVQDTVERALRFEAQYRRGTNFRAWINQILYSVFITRCRRERRERNALGRLASDPCAWTAPSPKAPMTSLSRPMAKALETVPPRYRAVVEMIDLGGCSYDDAARALKVPVGTVMSRVHRGRQQVASAIRVPKRAWAM